MDLTFLGWIAVGLIAGILSGIMAGGRSLRGWMPSLAVGVIAAVVTGWVMNKLVGADPVTSTFVAAVLATVTAFGIRLVVKNVTFED